MERRASFAYSSGPKNARIALVGEAWGKDEELIKLPFIGYSGQELTRLLADAEIKRSECFLTNVFAFRPLGNDIETLCAKKAEVGPGYALKPIKPGKYIKPEFLPELERLADEIRTVKPNLVVALGNVACWALLGSSGITALRGAVAESSLIPGQKVIATYHPAAILRDWPKRPIVVADLLKAAREMEFPEIRRVQREITCAETLDEIDYWIEHYALRATHLAVDIETYRGQIDMIGFASDPEHALNIKFFNTGTHENTWGSVLEEVEARKRVLQLLTLPAKKIFQNGLYDLQYLLREGFTIKNVAEDTMLLHHAMYPELPKGLGFLGSIYTNETAWKLLNRTKSEKKDE